MGIKTYVLTENMQPGAPIYQRISKDERVRIDKLPLYSPYRKITFQDADGINKTIRYKQNANSIFQDEQIKNDKIEANEPFTTNERRATEFRNGVLNTNEEILQKFLDAYPGNESFKGYSADIKVPEFRLLDKTGEIKTANDAFKKRVKAASKIANLDLVGMQEMLIRINGSFFVPPSDEMEAQDYLIKFLDAAEEAGLDAILKEDGEKTIDEGMTVLIGKLIQAEIISFDTVEGNVAKMINSKWIAVKDIPNEYSPEERKRFFSEFLISDTGKLLLDDLQKTLEGKTKKPAKQNA